MPSAQAEQRFPSLYFYTVKMDESYLKGESSTEFLACISDAFGKLCYEVEHHKLGPHVIIVTPEGSINIVCH